MIRPVSLFTFRPVSLFTFRPVSLFTFRPVLLFTFWPVSFFTFWPVSLPGKEIRSILDEKMAQLYWDLDGGFTHMAWLLPAWLPLPSFKKRDEAHLRVKEIFYNAIQTRKQTENKEDDMLQTLIDSTYK